MAFPRRELPHTCNFFKSQGIETVEQTVFLGRPNLIAKLPGRDSSRRVVFEAHMDTAGIVGMEIPAFEPEVSGGKVYGRGSCDTKAGLAAMMCALVRSRAKGIRRHARSGWSAPPMRSSRFAVWCAYARDCRRTRQLSRNQPHYAW